MLADLDPEADSRLVDRIYEAAFVPDLWPDVLGEIGARSSAPAGSLFVFDGKLPLGYQATETVRGIIDDFVARGEWRQNERIPYFQQNPFTGFVIAQEYYPPDFLAREPTFQDRLKLGLESQAGTIIPMPGGELAVYVFEKWRQDGPYTRDDIDSFDRLYPHLARAGLIAARLGLEQAQATVSALDAIGLPAAVLRASGRVLATNPLLEAMSWLFLPRAFDGLALADKAADALFKDAVAASHGILNSAVRSIPVAAHGGKPALILHVLPLRRAAHEIFSSADILLVATPVGASLMVPSPTILTGLFDLSPAEARLAAALASGRLLKEASAQSGITVKTARSYLEQIFRKTGTRQQSELVALLKSAGAVVRVDRD